MTNGEVAYTCKCVTGTHIACILYIIGMGKYVQSGNTCTIGIHQIGSGDKS